VVVTFGRETPECISHFEWTVRMRMFKTLKTHNKTMRRTLITAALLALAPLALRADIITQWNFNSNPPDGSTSTGSTAPSVGTGTASLVGGATATFASGDILDDPAPSADNTGWNTTTYPAASTGNKTRGVQFLVSTAGKENIVISFGLRASNSGSKYSRLQYTTNGTDWVDYPTAITLSTGNIFELETVDLTGFAAVSDNPNFGFRVVTEFESTATGSGAASYVTTTTSPYSTSGTLRFDEVTVFGTIPVGGNTPPTITSMTNQTTRVDVAATNFFTVGDAETALNSLILSGSSSNPALVTTGDINFTGTGADRAVIVTPEPGQIGTATITVTVTDGGGLPAISTYTLTVLEANTAPVISAIGRTNTLVNGSVQVPVLVNDLETPAGSLSLSATSSDTALLPVANIVFSGSDSNRIVTLTPAAGQTGAAAVTITVSDGTKSASSSFNLMVTPSANVLLNEPFNYADGSLKTNSGFFWNTRAGTAGQVQVNGGAITVSSANSEDISGPLIGSPIATGNSTVLYASFKVNFSSLPTGNGGDLFAHFANGSTLRGRIYASTSNAVPGSFRLRVANNSNSNTELAQDLNIGTTYTVVTRYNVDAPATTIWVNPTSESDASASATDSASGLAILSYDFREDTGIGTMTVDDVKVGLSFADVVSGTITPPSPIPLSIAFSGGSVTLSWTNSAFKLQSATSVAGPYSDVLGAASPYTTSTTGTEKYFRLKY
jgi:Bacterial Ig domain